MRIGIDARWIFPEMSGIGLYTQELIGALSRIDRTNQYTLFFRHRSVAERTAEATQFNTAPNVHTHLLPYGPFSPRSQAQLPSLFRDMKLDVFHATNYMIPFLPFPRHRAGETGCVVTIHDVIPLLFPDHAPRSKKTRLMPVFRRLMREVGRRADTIITVSECSKRDILAQLAIPPEDGNKVVVIPEGVTPNYHPATGTTPGTPRGKDILYVGRLDPYKNVVNLVEAFSRVLLRVPEARLVWIGPDDPRYPEAQELVERRGLQDRVMRKGHVRADELVAAYQEAAVLVLPSRYEGFGLPVLEAMACGTPVVCSDTSSLPEVAGDAATLVDPDNVLGLAEAISDVLTDPKLATELAEKGLARAASFKWDRTAERTLDTYRDVAERRPQK